MKCYWLIALLFLLISCREPFSPHQQEESAFFLVVEGMLNTTGKTVIRLSKTLPVGKKFVIDYEDKAKVWLENELGASQAFLEQAKGEYHLGQFTLSGEKYRLVIETSDRKKYVSSYIMLQLNPPIDDITWTRDADGVHLFLNTTGDREHSRHYRWEYEETWEFHTFKTDFKYVWPSPIRQGGHIERRTKPEDRLPFVCWQSNKSTNVNLLSTAGLTNNTIHQKPIVDISNNSWKLSTRYSVLVKQYALTEQGYIYWQRLRDNTEKLGSVFDPLPSEIKGNIYSLSNPEEQVIGFFEACNFQSKRIFIDESEVPGWLDDRNCVTRLTGEPFDFYFSGAYTPTGEGVGAKTECVDCRKMGTPVKPAFWN
jgi:hypothetical protein